MIKGFKIFNEDLTNRYGMKFEVDKTYVTTGQIKWGNNGNGFHMCTHLEDTFRYFDAINKKCQIAEVLGFNNNIIYNDEYYGYFDMYVVESLKIQHVLSREEIVNYLYNLIKNSNVNYDKVNRFICGYKLTEEEIIKIINILALKDHSHLNNYLYSIENFQKYTIYQKQYIKYNH